MDYRGIIITGTSGAGKTTITKELCEKNERFATVQAVTTRVQREDDEPGQYLYLTDDQFTKLDKRGELLIKSDYRGFKYGITNDAFHKILEHDQVPILVVTPESVAKIQQLQSQKELYEGSSFLSIFLDAPDNVLTERLKGRTQENVAQIESQRKDDRDHEESCTYLIINTNLQKVVKLIFSLWGYRSNEGILPQSLIQLLVECGTLLDNASFENISGASYDLTLGDEHWYGGKQVTLSEQAPFIKIEPFEFAFVRSKEICNLPRDITGRFGITVDLFLRGLIMSNGPQVDPGFRGGLWCLLFNTSSDTVHLKRGQHYATVEFSKILHETYSYKGQYQDKEKIADYLPQSASRSPISGLKKEIKSLKAEQWVLKILPLVLASLAIIITLLVALGVIKKGG